MNLAYVGSGPLDEAVFSRLAGTFQVVRVADLAGLEKVSRDCDVLVLGDGAGRSFGKLLAEWPNAAFGRVTTVIDQRVVDPELTRELAADLARSGIDLVDAPIHCEDARRFPELAAVLCGGSEEALARVRPVLDATGAKIICFGEIGSGHAAQILVGAAAVCNRMTTYECAAAGFSNGLGIEDMAHVLNRSSGNNSGTEHVLAHIGTGVRTTDLPLASVVDGMRLASGLAMRAGAPLLLAGVVGELCQSLANGLGSGTTFDDAVPLIEAASELRFTREGS